MAERNVTLEELYKMRGDIAIAALETVERDLEIVKLTLVQLRLMDKHYKLKNDLDSSGVMEIVKTLRYHSPELTEGKTDAEVLALFGKSA
jgi:hypothetical protein